MKSKIGIEIPMKWIAEFCQRWMIKEFAIFGSAIRDDFRDDSDVDILLSFKEEAPWGLSEIIDMRDELKEKLGREIDVVEREALRNPIRKKSILENHEVIYAA